MGGRWWCGIGVMGDKKHTHLNVLQWDRHSQQMARGFDGREVVAYLSSRVLWCVLHGGSGAEQLLYRRCSRLRSRNGWWTEAVLI
jgi:hypothetical protein